MPVTGHGDLFDRAAVHIRPVDTIYDIGAGIRPQPFFKAARHVCIEPHDEYAEWLEQHDYPVLRRTAFAALPLAPPVETIFLLDVIEHMPKLVGLDVIKMAHARATRQIVVFTPLGFNEQSYGAGEKDRWGMNGGYWQTHRSGWEPEDFPGWTIIEDPAFHGSFGAFFAIHG